MGFLWTPSGSATVLKESWSMFCHLLPNSIHWYTSQLASDAEIGTTPVLLALWSVRNTRNSTTCTPCSVVFWLIWLFTSQSTFFQLCSEGSSWVEPVLSKAKCVLMTHHTNVGKARIGSPSGSSQAFYHRAHNVLLLFSYCLWMFCCAVISAITSLGERTGCPIYLCDWMMKGRQSLEAISVKQHSFDNTCYFPSLFTMSYQCNFVLSRSWSTDYGARLNPLKRSLQEQYKLGFDYTVKPVLSGHSKGRLKIVF